ncbi:Ribose ABC transport system2C ATP-binding protein RbsA [gamma proteobacterium IMCC2047]|nr:Ribose ABC transport system2C ATP-binding protein RbsA [gamma proteobacterium IMCC2047]
MLPKIGPQNFQSIKHHNANSHHIQLSYQRGTPVKITASNQETKASVHTSDKGLLSNEANGNASLLCMKHISKQFFGSYALNNIDFEVRSGEVHALFGGNGVGKSTLIQIIAGDIQPSSGKIILNQEEIKIRSVYHARELGISAVFQESSLIPELSVEANLFLGSEERSIGPFLNKRNLHKRANNTLKKLGFELDPEQLVMHLSRAEQQMVEIAKAFRTKPSIMILDEPTASLTEHETNQLFSMIDFLKNEGIAVIYITHKIPEIYKICDRVTILRDSKRILTQPVSDISEQSLVETAVGSRIDELFPYNY